MPTMRRPVSGGYGVLSGAERSDLFPRRNAPYAFSRDRTVAGWRGSASVPERQDKNLFGSQGLPCGILCLERLGTHGGAKTLAIEIAQAAFQRLEGFAQVLQYLVGRAVQACRPAWLGPVVAGHGQTDQRIGGACYHPHAPGLVERFREEGFGVMKRATKVLGQAEVEGLVDDTVVVVQRTGDVERLEQVLAGAIQVTQRELGIPEVADHRSHLEPVPGLAVEQERFSSIASRASMVSFDVHGERPDGQEAGGQMRFPQSARQA